MGRIINPYQQYLDAEGNVLSNGRLTFYENGTTTPKIIYSDAALTIEQNNPYTLDGSGRIIGDVWLDGTYSVLVQDSDLSTIRTDDDVSNDTSSGGGGETVQGQIQNKFINGSCRVPSDVGSVTVSGSYQESGVDSVFVKAQGTPTNGTADLVKTTLSGSTGYALQVTDLTTGAGGTVDYRFRFNSVDSRDLVDGPAIFQCNVLQQTGLAKNYTISISTATAEDNFTSVSLISQSAGESVPDSVDTTISHSVADMGSCENGIEIVVSCASGAVTTRDFFISDIVFRKGQSLITFEQNPYAEDLSALKFAQEKANIDKLRSQITVVENYVRGLRLRSAADTDHDITVAIGQCYSAADQVRIDLTSEITKQLDAAWAEGDNAGGLPSGVTLSGPEWLYFFLISKTDGTVDAGFDDNASATNLLADATDYVYYQHIGSVRTDASDNIAGTASSNDDETVIVDQKTSGTNGGDFSSGAYRTRDLNTVLSDAIHGIVVSSNQVSIPAGTYMIRASAPGVNVGSHQTRLQNITDGSTLILGTSESATTSGSTSSFVNGRITLDDTKTVELQHECSATQLSFGFGLANTGDAEVYAILSIRRLP